MNSIEEVMLVLPEYPGKEIGLLETTIIVIGLLVYFFFIIPTVLGISLLLATNGSRDLFLWFIFITISLVYFGFIYLIIKLLQGNIRF